MLTFLLHQSTLNSISIYIAALSALDTLSLTIYPEPVRDHAENASAIQLLFDACVTLQTVELRWCRKDRVGETCHVMSRDELIRGRWAYRPPVL